MKRVTSSFVSSVVNEDPALNIKVQVIVAVGIILSYGSLVLIITFVVSKCDFLYCFQVHFFWGGRHEASAQQR